MILGVCGRMGSGKGTVADILVQEQNFQKLSFADSLKDGVSAMFSWPRHLLEGDTEESRAWREQTDAFWCQETGRTVTPRLVLQEVGTDCMRSGFFDGIWVSIVKQTVAQSPGTDWVIPDVRFPNEISMIQSLGGTVIEVERGARPDWVVDYLEQGIEPTSIHDSEWRYLETPVDCIIKNNGTVNDLRSQVSDLLAAI